ncbi:hypothetical protein M5689_016778 [Euphorbia peplus]|nr:hypothetical protein M5689_016778 [Euphorbia peplus]
MGRQDVVSWGIALLGFGLCSLMLLEAMDLQGKTHMTDETKPMHVVKPNYRTLDSGYGVGSGGSGSGFGMGGSEGGSWPGQAGGYDKGGAYGNGGGHGGGFGSGGGYGAGGEGGNWKGNGGNGYGGGGGGGYGPGWVNGLN